MARRWGMAAVVAATLLWMHGAFALSSWADGWVLNEEYDALPTGCLALLMMGLLTLAALYDWGKRRGQGRPPSWWRLPARAFAPAAVLTIAALVYGLPIRIAHPVSFLIQCLWWNRWTRYLFAAISGERITFLLVITGVLSLLWKGSPQRWQSAWAGRKPWRWLIGLFLLTSLGIALHVAWMVLTTIGPDLLIAPFGYRSICGYVTCEWYRVPGSFQRPDPMLVVRMLDLFSGTVLLLWLFQWLWLLTGKDGD